MKIMQSLMIHGFENPLWLIIGGVFLLCILFFILCKKAQSNFVDESLVQEVYARNSLWYRVYGALILSITALFFIILSNPYNNQQIEKITKNGIDIEIVFDVSQSMIAQDVSPNRLDAAKSVVSDFVSSLSSDRLGFILFSGKAFQSIPLSYDYDFIRGFISQIDISTIDQQNSNLGGTAIGDALVLAADVLSQGENTREKVIILITDGTANRGVDPDLALKLLREQNIKVYTIGVGKEQETFIDVAIAPGFTRRDPVAGVDENMLTKISEDTGGVYFRADSPVVFKQILDRIATLEKSELEMEIISFHASQSKTFLYLLLGCFTLLLYIVFVKKIRF